MGKKAVRELENVLIGVQGGFTQYRSGVDEFFVPYGFAIAREKLMAARGDLERLGQFESCCEALARAEELAKLGPEHDEEAEMLILNANRALMTASGRYDEMSQLAKKPGVTLDDFKPDPDHLEQEDQVGGTER
ncbi:MAG: hypothetical protein V4858_14180 [Pseudomonadota bacterium]